MTLLSEKENGQSFEVNVGEMITVRLSENPTTGHRWTVVAAQGLDQVESKFEAGKGVGAPGMRAFQFRATQPGPHELRLKNRREWEDESGASTQFEARIIVK